MRTMVTESSPSRSPSPSPKEKDDDSTRTDPNSEGPEEESCGNKIIGVAFYALLPIALITIGIAKLDQCPVSMGIPIFMIAMGVVILALAFLHYLFKIEVLGQIAVAVIFVGFFSFLLAATLWVTWSLKRVETTKPYLESPIKGWKGPKAVNPNYCDPIVYWPSFILIAVCWILIILAIPNLINEFKKGRGSTAGENQPIVSR
eukprot:sb/3470547/